MNYQRKKSRKGGFNIMDALILLVVLVIVLVALYVMFFSDYDIGDKLKANGQSVTIVYTLEVSPIDDDFQGANGELPFEIGDSFYSLDEKYSLGTITTIGQRQPFLASTGLYLPNAEGKNELQYAAYPGRSSVTIQVTSQGERDGATYLVDGHALRVGDSFTFSTPYYIGTCRCVTVEEVTANA